MAQPSDLLRELAAHGRRIQADLLVAKQSKKSVNTNVAVGVEALDIFFDISGRKKLASRIGKNLVHSSANSRIEALQKEAEHWVSDAKAALKNFSVARNGVPRAPNSDQLVRSFFGVTKYSKPETRLSHGIAYLEDLANSSLFLNEELEDLRRAVEIIDKSAPSVPDEIQVGFKEMLTLVAPFRSEHEAISGAFATYKAKGPDWQRQTLDSLRNALENLVSRFSGESMWTVGLAKIISSDVEQKPIKDAYNLLSARGTHAEDVPSEHVVAFSIGLTQKAMKYIVDCNERG